ncbi:hypothetical protein [Flavobacterium sp.]|jgi:hypothetical protein|uniref:hypothetical protein n=1 Tax=Flavobacterium sp. TaxID=239 RepID=UPI0037C13BF5
MEVRKIPISDSFYIDTDGNVFDSKGVKRNTSVNGDGYVTVNIKTKQGLWITFGVHRLVALTYIERKDLNRNQVNHRDLILTNNSVKNLEWVTTRENNIHSEILRNTNPQISVYSVKDGVVQFGYANAHEAAKSVGCSPLDVWDSIKDNINVNGVKFCFRKFSEPLPLELKHNRKTNFTHGNRSGPIPVRMLDIYSGEEIEFSSIGEAARNFKTTPSHIFQAISKTIYPRVFLKRYQVVYSGDDFPTMTVEEKERAKTHGRKKVIAFDLTNQKWLIFSSAAEFIKQSKLSKKAVTVSLKNNKIRAIGGWISLYLTDENLKLVKSYISGPAEI